MIVRAIASPIPIPSVFVVKSGSKTSSSLSANIPKDFRKLTPISLGRFRYQLCRFSIDYNCSKGLIDFVRNGRSQLTRDGIPVQSSKLRHPLAGLHLSPQASTTLQQQAAYKCALHEN